MERFPMLWEGKRIGEPTTEKEALYTCFSVRCRPPGAGLWCAWAVGERGELRLGVLEPAGDYAAISRRFSERMTAPMGTLVQGQLRSVESAGETGWETAPEPERLFHSPWLRRQLHGAQGVLTRTEGKGRRLALPYDEKKPFPLTSLFCFSALYRIEGRRYVVFTFDKEDWPVPPRGDGRQSRR
ncbi:hypothetical protein [Oscillibacter sp.]|uniref:hypothetical protein n=1 Tax=Oscillibacter sp. TaxID=1945593 RepID=UPI0026375ABB|nr:hypothetical protein [Oscillibacter sp.]MDD3346235.1 hypothetical protein [Oscillibacter sp.]